MPLVFAGSRINLNISLRSIHSGIPLRVLDIMACGGFVISNWQPEIAEYFEEGKEIVTFRSLEECMEKIAYYLEHEEERKEIAAAGFRKVKERFSYREGLSRVFSCDDSEKSMNISELKQKVDSLIWEERYDDIKTLLLSHKDITEHDNELSTVCYLCTVYEQERDAGLQTIFSKVSDRKELLERYIRLKFYLRRIEFNVMDDGLESFNHFLVEQNVSSYELLAVIGFCAADKDNVLKKIRGELPCTVRHTVSAGPFSDANGDVSHEKEFCFIICANDKMYEEECLYYIEHLRVPDGYHIDVLTVEDARSITSGYNEAMHYSKAKYKVYLHQDVFIINPDFMADCLEIFERYPKVGMLGNVGVQNIPKSGVMWEADRYGMLYEQHIYETKLLANQIEQITDMDYLAVDAIDGFIMITQYDIPWREDLFDKWDFYDCSQSMEFIRRGFQVAVPQMSKPWCVHDCGFVNLDQYDGEREKFVREYLQPE
jgi:hypothetical protein